MSSTTITKQLPLGAKLDILPAAINIALTGLFSILTGFWRSERDAPSLFLHIAYAVLRKVTSRLSPLQLQFLSPSTEERYNQWSKSVGITPQTVAVGHGANAHWIGDPKAHNVMIWYHGGGFCVPANAGYFKFWDNLVQSSRVAGKELSILAVGYSLAPNAPYPTQLIQAVDALRYVLQRANHQPSQVLLGGDSVGGNLAIGVLSHLAHPHPDIEPLVMPTPVAGLAVIGPKTSHDDKFDEASIYSGGDLVTPYTSKVWSRAYLGGRVPDYYTDPSDASSTWFETLPVKRILVVAGQNEILLPRIRQFVELLKVGFPSVEFLVGTREAHIAPIFNLFLGDKKETKQGQRLKMWLKELL